MAQQPGGLFVQPSNAAPANTRLRSLGGWQGPLRSIPEMVQRNLSLSARWAIHETLGDGLFRKSYYDQFMKDLLTLL